MEILLSTLLYLFVFGTALFFFWLAERQYKREPRDASKGKRFSGGTIWAIVAILLLTLFAAVRAESVGADTKGYPVVYSDYARQYPSFIGFLNDPVLELSSEPLGALTIWLCARLSETTIPLLFCYQLFTVLPVFLAARELRDRLPLTMAMAVYLFFFYNNSLNNMRQSVTCALFLLSFAYIIADGKIKPRAIFAAALGALFHKSAVYGILLLGVTAFSSKASRKWMLCLCALEIAFPLFITEFSTWLVSAGLVDSHMEYYFNVFVTGDIGEEWTVNPFSNYSLAYLLMYSALVMLPYILQSSVFSRRRVMVSAGREQPVLYKFLYSFLIVGYLLYVMLLFSLSTMYGMRFSMFFDFFLILAIPLSCNGESRDVKKVFVLMVLNVIWLVWIVRLGWSASVPYDLTPYL